MKPRKSAVAPKGVAKPNDSAVTPKGVAKPSARTVASGGVAMRIERPLVLVLGIAFLLRLAAVVWLSDTVPHSDAAYYHLAAQKMAADWKFAFDRSQVEYYGKLGWWPPLYPTALSLVYRTFGVSHRAAVYLQVLLGTLVVGLVYAIGRRAGGARLAWIAALLVAVNPTYVFLTNILASENLYAVWLALGLWLAGRAWPRLPAAGGLEAALRECRHLLLAGVVFGLGSLTRAIGTLVPVVVALASRRRAATRRAWLVGGACLVGASAVVIAPWTLRNAVVAGSPALVCFGGGLNFWFGHNAGGVGYVDLAQTPMAQCTTQAEIDRMGYRLGLEYLARQPLGFVTRGVRKVGALFGSPGYAPHENSAILLPDGWQTDPEKGRQAEMLRARQRAKNVWLDGVFTQLGRLHSWLLLGAALVACFAWRRLPDDLRVAAWVCLYWIAAHVVFWAQPRFRYPMEIPLALLAASALARIGSTRRLAVTAALLAGVLVAGCASSAPPLPPIEDWGNVRQPYDDAIEIAADAALGKRPLDYDYQYNPDPVRLGEFLTLSRADRDIREHVADSLVGQAGMWRRMSGIDSLGTYTEALRVDPAFVPAYVEAMRALLARGATQRARALGVQAVRLDAGDARLWAMLGDIYQRQGDDTRARQAFERALELGADGAPGTWQALTATYLRLGEAARAESLLQRVPPQHAASLETYARGVRAREAGDLEGARSAFASAAADSQAATAVVVEWGNAEFAAGHLDAAEGAYRRALRADPESRQAWNGLGVVQRRRGKLEDATRSFGHVVAQHPEDGTAQFNLAGASLEAAQRMPRGARADSLLAIADASFAACVDLGFHAPDSRLRRAEIQLLRGQPEAAYRQARALVADPALAPTARLLAGRAALAAHRPQDAVVVLAPAFQVDSLSTDGMALLGSAYRQLEMPADAARVLRRAHERDPADWQTAMNLGVALSQSGDLSAAEDVLRPLATAHPREPDVLQNLAAVLQRRGKRGEADRLLRQAEALR